MLNNEVLGLGIASHSKKLGLILYFHLLCFKNRGKQSELENHYRPNSLCFFQKNITIMDFGYDDDLFL